MSNGYVTVTLDAEDTPDEFEEKLANWEYLHDAPDSFIEYLKREFKRKPDTVSTRQSRLQIYAGWLNDMGLKPEKVDHRQVSEFLWWMESEGYAGSTVKSHYRTLRHYYNYLEEWVGVIEEEENPFEALTSTDFGENGGEKDKHREKHRKYLRYEEKEKLKENAPTPKLRNVLMLELTFQTGMRQEEIVELEIDDINRDDRSISVWGKGGKERTVFYKPSLDSLLDRYLTYIRPEFYHADDSPYLFLTEQSNQLNQSTPGRMIRSAAENAGLLEELPPDVNGKPRYWPTWHSLRHGHAVEALRSPDITLRDLQMQLGHHSLEITAETYLDMIPEDRKRAYQSFGAHRND